MEFYKVLESRRSIRNFKPDSVRPEVLDKILSVIDFVPSAKNIQPWEFIVTKDKSIREQLSDACLGQRHVREAPVVITAVGDPKVCYGNMGGTDSSLPIDVGMALYSFMLAASNEGLGTCWIGAFDENKVKKILDIPKELKVVGLTPLGHPKETPDWHKRKSRDSLFHEERYR